MEQPGFKVALEWDAGTVGGGLTCATVPTPTVVLSVCIKQSVVAEEMVLHKGSYISLEAHRSQVLLSKHLAELYSD